MKFYGYDPLGTQEVNISEDTIKSATASNLSIVAVSVGMIFIAFVVSIIVSIAFFFPMRSEYLSRTQTSSQSDTSGDYVLNSVYQAYLTETTRHFNTSELTTSLITSSSLLNISATNIYVTANSTYYTGNIQIDSLHSLHTKFIRGLTGEMLFIQPTSNIVFRSDSSSGVFNVLMDSISIQGTSLVSITASGGGAITMTAGGMTIDAGSGDTINLGSSGNIINIGLSSTSVTIGSTLTSATLGSDTTMSSGRTFTASEFRPRSGDYMNFRPNAGNSSDIVTYTHGNAYMTGTLTQLSDPRFKTNITEATEDEINEAIDKLTLDMYYLTPDYAHVVGISETTRIMGFISTKYQENFGGKFTKIIPEMTLPIHGTNQTVTYTGVVGMNKIEVLPITVGGVKIHKRKIAELESEVAALKANMTRLIQHLNLQ